MPTDCSPSNTRLIYIFFLLEILYTFDFFVLVKFIVLFAASQGRGVGIFEQIELISFQYLHTLRKK